LIIALSGVFIGYTLSQVSPILGPTYIQFWNVNFSQDAIMIIMVGIPTITAILGASMTKFTLAHLSRKNSLVVAAVGVIVSSCIMVIPYPESLMIGRILEGVAVGFAMGITSIYLR
jgi:MFS family permease